MCTGRECAPGRAGRGRERGLHYSGGVEGRDREGWKDGKGGREEKRKLRREGKERVGREEKEKVKVGREGEEKRG